MANQRPGEISTAGGCFFLVLLGAVWAVAAALTSPGVGFVLTMLLALGGAIALSVRNTKLRARLAAERLAVLTARFGADVAQRILAKQYWQGATFEMIHESLGAPVDTKESVMKTKTKTTYCYTSIAANRFALRVHFENGVVVGWDQA